MHLTDCCWFLIRSGCVSVMGGWVGNAVRKHFCPVKFSPPPIRPPRFSPCDSSPSPPPHLGPAILQLEDSRVHKTTYAPMIYTAQCVMFLMGADTLCGEVGGSWRWKSRVFWAPNCTRLSARAISQGPNVKRLCGRCLSVLGPDPHTRSPYHTVYCIHYSILSHRGKGAGGGRDEPERRLEGQQFSQLGRK